MNLEAAHVRILRRMLEVGEPVQFVDETSDYDETTDTFSNKSVLVVSGHAVEIDGDLIEYSRDNLLELDPVTLLFVPDTFGQLPEAESDINWRGKVRKARKVKRLQLGAKVILV